MVYCNMYCTFSIHVMENKSRIHSMWMGMVVCAFDQDAQKGRVVRGGVW